jgi:hypothetical protein
MKIPVYERQVDQQKGEVISPSKFQPAQITLDTGLSGSAYDTAAAKLGNVVFDIAEKVGNHVIRMRDQDNQKSILDLDRQYQDELNQTILVNNETIVDPVTKQEKASGLYLRQNENADGIYKEYLERTIPLNEKYLNQAPNDFVRESLQSRIAEHTKDQGLRIITKQAQERENAIKSSLTDSVKMANENIGAYVGQYDISTKKIQETGKDIENVMKSMGMPRATIELAKAKSAKEATMNLIRVSPSADTAKKHYEKVKGLLTTDDQKELELTLNGKVEDESHFNYVQVIRNTDAFKTNNKEAIRNNIFARKDLTVERKQKLWNYTEAAVNEHYSNNVAYRSTQQQAIENRTLEIMANNGSVDQAVKELAVTHDTSGNQDNSGAIALNEKKIRAYWDKNLPPENETIKSDLETAAHIGEPGTFESIDKALANGDIHPKTHTALKRIYTAERNPGYKAVITELEKRAKKVTGRKKGTPEFNDFIIQVKSMSENNPDKFIENADKLGTKAPGTGYIWDDTYWKTSWKDKLKREEAVKQQAQPLPPSEALRTEFQNYAKQKGVSNNENNFKRYQELKKQGKL